MENTIYFVLGSGILSILYLVWTNLSIQKQKLADQELITLNKKASDGIISYIKLEYQVLIVAVVAVGVLLFVQAYKQTGTHSMVALSFLVGAVFSAVAAFLGTAMANKVAPRSIDKIQSSARKGVQISTSGGSYIAQVNTVAAILGISLIYLLVNHWIKKDWDLAMVMNIVAGYAFGASMVSFFLNVNGSVFQHALNSGNRMIMQQNQDIPQNTVINPANVSAVVSENAASSGAKIGDAGETISIGLISAMVLGVLFTNSVEIQAQFALAPVVLPLAIAASGMLLSVLGAYLIQWNNKSNIQQSFNAAEYAVGGLSVVAAYFIIQGMLPSEWVISADGGTSELVYSSIGVFWSVLIGAATVIGIGKFTEYFTAQSAVSLKNILSKVNYGTESTVTAGLNSGTISAVISIFFILVSIMAGYYFAGAYGVAMTGVGMLMLTGIQQVFQQFLPIISGAGIMSDLTEIPEDEQSNLQQLEKNAEQTNAQSRGYAITTTAVAAMAGFMAVLDMSDLQVINMVNPLNLALLVAGILMPFIFNALINGTANRAAQNLVNETSRQFTDTESMKNAGFILQKYQQDLSMATPEELEVIAEAAKAADVEKCVDAVNKTSINGLIIPLIFSVGLPVAIVYVGGMQLLGAFLSGVFAGSFILMAVKHTSGIVLLSNSYKTMVNLFKKSLKLKMESTTVLHQNESSDFGRLYQNLGSQTLHSLLKVMIATAIVMAPVFAFETDHIPAEKALATEVVISPEKEPISENPAAGQAVVEEKSTTSETETTAEKVIETEENITQ